MKSKTRPVCTHCGLLEHTIECCYKLHGYLSGYKNQGQRNSTSSAQTKQVNYVSSQIISPIDPKSTESPSTTQSTPNVLHQCQQLLNLLQSQFSAQNVNNSEASLSHVAGTFGSWILDYGASVYICCSKSLFDVISPIFPVYVTLSNKSWFLVEFSSSVRLTTDVFSSWRSIYPPVSLQPCLHQYVVRGYSKCCGLVF